MPPLRVAGGPVRACSPRSPGGDVRAMLARGARLPADPSRRSPASVNALSDSS
jgi:hypothetical protein